MTDVTADSSLNGVGVSVNRIRETAERLGRDLWEGVSVLGVEGDRQSVRDRLGRLVELFGEALDGQANRVGGTIARRLSMASQDQVEALRRRIEDLERGLETLEEARNDEERRTAAGT